MWKKLALISAMTAAMASGAFACTTVLVDQAASADHAFYIARSVDGHENVAQLVITHPAVAHQKGVYSAKALNPEANDFKWPLPEKALAYRSTPSFMATVKDPLLFHDGAAGFNELGVGVSGTESIYASPEALKVDPYNEESGISEMDITNVLLPAATSAREGVKLLGKIVETVGAAEGMGVAFVDEKELWYFETGSGHQWLAQRLPKDTYFASGNQGRLQTYKPNDPDYLASPNLVSFAKEHGLYREQDGDFNFSKAYTRNDERDRTYNDPRVWQIQKSFTPSVTQVIDQGRTFPVFQKADKALSLDDIKAIMRNHYQGTEFDPYTNGLKPDSKNRPISVFRAYQVHILQVRPELPKAIGEVHYLAMGMSDLSVFLPFYQGVSTVPEAFTTGTDQASDNSAYWKMRKLQGIVMTNYPKLAPIVHKGYADFEKAVSQEQEKVEAQYLKMVKHQPMAAQKLLSDFNAKVLNDATALTDRLTNDVMTVQTQAMLDYIPFNNRKKHD